MTGWRRQVELTAGPVVVLASRLPRVVPFLVVGVVLLGGLLARGVLGAALLLAVGAALGLLLALSWPALRPEARAVRVAVVGLVLLRGVAFLF